MATPSGPGNVGTAADALIQAGGGIYDEMEEEEVADIDLIPFGTQEEVEEAMTHARTAKTLRSYEVAVNSLLSWCTLHKDEQMVREVVKIRDNSPIEFDYPKLAKSLESMANVYFRYTLQYQIKMNLSKKSGLGHIKRVRSGLSKKFLDNRVTMSDLALKLTAQWMASRKNDDMAAKTREINPVKYSNAQRSLPWPAYKAIAHLLAKEDPFLWCLFILQWNMIARVSNAAGVKLSLMSWDNDRLKIKHPKTKMDGEGKKAFPMAIMANRYCWYICPITSLAVYMSCCNFKKDTDQLFSGGTGKSASTRYCERMRSFLKREDIQTELNEYADLLKGSHGVRKGATNHGATAGLVANVLIAVLLFLPDRKV